MFVKTLLVASIALAPAVSLAQSTPPLYIGASFNVSTFSPFRSYSSNLYGPALTVGYQLSPRWAIQSGASWGQRSDRPSNIGRPDILTTPTIFKEVNFDLRYTRLTIPVLARFTLTDPTKPLQVDALFGPSWIHATSRNTTTFVLRAGGSNSDTSTYSDNNFSAGLGPSIRYTVSPHLQVTANSMVQAEFGDGFDIVNRRFSDRMFLTTQLGVQYRFGR
jgi:hypothetical protein